MALPTSYTETEIKQYMLDVLENTGPASEWTTNSFQEQLYDLLIDYGVSDIASATNIAKLRALARVQAWRKMVNAVSGDFDYSADEAEYNRRVVYEHALRQLTEAENLAVEWLGRNQATFGEMTWDDDPYQSVPVRGSPYFAYINY